MISHRFAGQVALVTGGSAGLGFGIARRLADEGALVVLAARGGDRLTRAARDITASGGRAESLVMNVTDEASVRDGIAVLVGRHGRLDILVHSAGVVGATRVRATEYPTEEFDRVLAVNLRGTFLVAKHALGAMAKAGRGRALLLASMAGRDGNANMMGYTASKAAVFGVVKALGREFADAGVSVNGFAPAVVQTALVDDMAPDHVAWLKSLIPMKRMGTIEEVAALAAWIVSPECTLTTGFVFDASGGRATY